MDRMDLSESDKSMRDEQQPKSAAAPSRGDRELFRAANRGASTGAVLTCSADMSLRGRAVASPRGNVSRRGDLQRPPTLDRRAVFLATEFFTFPRIVFSHVCRDQRQTTETWTDRKSVE